MAKKKKSRGRRKAGNSNQSSAASKRRSDWQKLPSANTQGVKPPRELAPSPQRAPLLPLAKVQMEPAHSKTLTWEKISRAATLAGVAITGSQFGYQVLHDAGIISFAPQVSPTAKPVNSAGTRKQIEFTLTSEPVPVFQGSLPHERSSAPSLFLQQRGELHRDADGQWYLVSDEMSVPLATGNSMLLGIGDDQFIRGKFIETKDKKCYFVSYYRSYTEIVEGMCAEVVLSR